MTGVTDDAAPAFWAGLSVTEEETLEVLDSGKKAWGVRDRRVCMCGHMASAHRTALGITRCEPSRMRCPCPALQVALEASHVIGFMAKTEGVGARHALLKGLAASRRTAVRRGSDFTVRWVVPLECQRCAAIGRTPVSPEVQPAAITAAGVASDEPEALNAMLCGECVREVSA